MYGNQPYVRTIKYFRFETLLLLASFRSLDHKSDIGRNFRFCLPAYRRFRRNAYTGFGIWTRAVSRIQYNNHTWARGEEGGDAPPLASKNLSPPLEPKIRDLQKISGQKRGKCNLKKNLFLLLFLLGKTGPLFC